MHRNHSRMLETGAAVVFALVLALGLAFAPQPAVGQDATEGNFMFRWAFGAISGSGNNREITPVDRDMVLKSGDQLKMLVEAESPCYVYVIHAGEGGSVELLFPYEFDRLGDICQASESNYVPKGEPWLALDNNPGRETFYLLASAQRLTELENLLKAYAAAEQDKKAEAGEQVVAEIKNIKKQNRQLSTTAERPVTIGGNVRGVGAPKGSGVPDVADIAVEISGTGFYAKTFSIEHQ